MKIDLKPKAPVAKQNGRFRPAVKPVAVRIVSGIRSGKIPIVGMGGISTATMF
ncbi:MAG: hypothetical protein ACLR56_06310 [Oscillospiraceae bacterium]